MNIEIYGGGFKNKGALLMINAVLDQVRRWNQKNTVSLKFRRSSFHDRYKFGLWHLISINSLQHQTLSSAFNLLPTLIPKNTRSRFHIITEGEIDALFDISGFAYGDQWGIEKTKRTGSLIRNLKKKGCKIYLLPQALGPFELPGHGNAFLEILKNSDLIFARDRMSYEYASKFTEYDNKLHIFPDFTNIVKGIDPENNTIHNKSVAFIPSFRMIQKGYVEKPKYIDFFKRSITLMFEENLDPFILIHDDTLNDIKLSQEINDALSNKLLVIREWDPLKIKGILGKCYAIIGSRYHAIVSGLSQAVPCIGTAWSHKYQMLFEQYNCKDLIVNLSEPFEYNKIKIMNVLNFKKNISLRKRLSIESEKHRYFTNKMWKLIRDSIGSSIH